MSDFSYSSGDANHALQFLFIPQHVTDVSGSSIKRLG